MPWYRLDRWAWWLARGYAPWRCWRYLRAHLPAVEAFERGDG